MFKIYPQWNFLKTIVFVALFLPVLGWAQVPTNGLVAYYPFNGNANDESGNGNHGVVNGATLTTDRFGNANKAYSFNGTDNKINGIWRTPLNSFSASFWINTSSLNNTWPCFVNIYQQSNPSNGLHINLSTSPSGAAASNYYFSVHNQNTTLYSSGGVSLNKWKHLTITYQNGVGKIYIDGVLDNTVSGITSGNWSNLDVFYLGQEMSGAQSTFYNGKLDDIRIYNLALSTTEVTQLYQAEAPPVTLQTGLVAYYPFNGNANDESGNGNNPTTNTATLTSDRFGNANRGYSFNGQSTYITLPAAINSLAPNSYSIVAWIKPTSLNSRLDGYEPISDRDASSYQYKFRLNYGISNVGFVNDTTYIQTCNNCTNTSNAIFAPLPNLNQWTQYIITYDAASQTFKGYVNSSILGTLTNIVMPSGNRNINLGRTLSPAYPSGVAWFSGEMDDIRIYNRALSSQEVTMLYNSTANVVTTTQPQITLSTMSVTIGSTINIRGEGFNPFGKVYFDFVGAADQYRDSSVADINGKLTFTYTANPSRAQAGTAAVRATDVIRNLNTSFKGFNITVPIVTPQRYLSIAAPTAGQSYEATRTINVTWNDLMVRKYGTFTYPMFPGTAKRAYSYKIEYQVGANGVWETLTNVGGGALLNSTLSRTIPLVLSTSNAACRVRVTDNLVNTIIATSAVFAVTPYISNINASLEWDYSFPRPATAPQGVAADGVSRLYVKAFKQNATSPAIQSVAIHLSDGVNSAPQMLGKVQIAQQTNSYSTEANNASAITANATNLNPNGEAWFWYVAPNDFSQSNTGAYSNAGERVVTATLTASLSNGTTETVTLPIRIVRPPLMMVHGLASSEAAFTNFHYTGTGTPEVPFRESSLFKHKQAINLIPNAEFSVNANVILSPNCGGCGVNGQASNYINTFQGNVDAIRQQGYAANQVDYICHSMGGCVLRTAMTVFAPKFYGTAGAANDLYKSYGQGFVHKAITINTPHNSSPVADAITEYIPQIATSVNVGLTSAYLAFPNNLPFSNISMWDFIKPTDPNTLPFTFEATGAVRNLQVKGIGGVNLAATNVKHHLIAGDIDLYSPQTASTLAMLDEYVDLLDKVLKTVREKLPPSPAKNYLTGLMALNKTLRAFTFIEWYSQQKTYPNFLGDGDIIVPLASQLADVTVPAVVPANATIFPSTSFLNANHSSILNRADVGDRVKELLNNGLSNPLFGNTIAATANIRNPTDNGLTLGKMALLTTSYDTLKVVIDAPFRNAILVADSTIHIRFRLKDTALLAYVEYTFQRFSDISTSRAPNQTLSLQVDPNYMGRQTIYLTAVYDRPTGTEYHIDTLSVNVRTTARFLDFEVSPKVATLFKNTPYYPSYKATYDAFIVSVPANSPNLSVVVENPRAVSYNSTGHYFVGLDTLTTFAKITYQGIVDTIYFNVIDTTSILSGINESLNPNQKNVIDIKVYPNPFQEVLNVEYELPQSSKVSLQLTNWIGQIVYSTSPSQQAAGKQQLQFPVNLVPNGMYILTVKTDFGAFSSKVLKND